MDEQVMLQEKKPRKMRIFPWFLCLYACIVLIAMGFGLHALENYLRSYEKSLPYNTTDAYLQALTPDHICEQAASVLTQIDTSVQTHEEALAVMKAALSEPVSFYKRVKECTDTKLVYTLRSGKQTIGSFEMEQSSENEQGFSPWVVTKEQFDLSFLLEDGFTVTAPHDATVTVNGKPLTEQHIIEAEIPYGLLADFYGEYELPTLTTYRIGRHLGQISVQVTDAAGNPLDYQSDPSSFLDNCTDGEKTNLDQIAESFITDYIHFTSQTNMDINGNLARLCEHIVPGGALEKRMRDAVRGLNWVTDRHASIRSIEVNSYVSIGDGRYICDITYLVDTHDISGEVQSESGLSVVFIQTDGGLKAETMISH